MNYFQLERLLKMKQIAWLL